MLAKAIAAKWKTLIPPEKYYYEELAAKDRRRYALEIVHWKMQAEHREHFKRNPSNGTSSMEDSRQIAQEGCANVFPWSTDSSLQYKIPSCNASSIEDHHDVSSIAANLEDCEAQFLADFDVTLNESQIQAINEDLRETFCSAPVFVLFK